MSANKPSQGFSESVDVYSCYKKDSEDFLTYKVLPSLKQKHGETLLRSLFSAWSSYKRMANWLNDMFHCLNNYTVSNKTFVKLREISCTSFKDVVFSELEREATQFLIRMIHDERENVPIDGTVVKGVIDIYIEVKLGQTDFYEAHFEKALLEATSKYYCKKAHAWILDDSCQQYMAKVEVSLEEEKQRAAHYMPSSSKTKILQAVQVEMMQIFVDKILKDDTLGFQALLCDKKDDDLSRMFVLFAAADGGLIQLSKIFKEHILKEVASLKKEAACSACRINEFVYKVIKLHDKNTEYIDKCFDGHPMFKKAIKEAFECVCNEDVADRSIADVFSTFCADVLTKTGREMGTDEPTEEIVEKVVKLLTYMSSKDLFLRLYRKKLEMRLSIDGKIEIAFLLNLKPWFGVQYSSFIDEIVKYFTVQVSTDKVKLLGGMNCGPVQSDVIHYQVLDEYLNSARVVSINARTRLAFNQLVLEYITPFNAGFKRNAKYTLEGYSIFGGLVSHVTNGHAANRSWNGKITSKMFYVIQGQIHMFSWAWALGKTCTEDSCLNDLIATIALVLESSKLITPNGALVPQNLSSLGANLKKVKRGSVLGSKLRTYVRCNAAFASHSQKSCFCWHIRRFELSKNRFIQGNIRFALEAQTSIADWRKDVQTNPLFKATFTEAARMNAHYGTGPRELCRFIRDWHTHCHQNLTEAMKIKYSFEILEEVAEAYFGAYLSDILFNLLMAGYDIDAWFSSLVPALPMQKEISKGG